MCSEHIEGDEWGTYVALARAAPPERGMTYRARAPRSRSHRSSAPMWRKSLYLKGGTTGATWVKQHLTRSYDRGHLRPKGTRGQEHDATRLMSLSRLSRCIGGRVDREVAHPGPSQIRTCPTRASGSSNLQVCYVPPVVCTILTRGSG